MTRPARTGALRVARSAVTLVLAVSCLGAGPLGATRTTWLPPPPNPSDDQLQHGHEQVSQRAAQVGELTNRLADADARLAELSARVEAKLEEANKARVDQQRAEDVARSAGYAAEATAADAAAAARQLDQARARLDVFTASSYRQGSVAGSLSGFLGSGGPRQMLDRAEVLDAVSVAHRNALDGLRRAQLRQVDKDSVARAALADARRKQGAATQARLAADTAERDAISAREQERGSATQLQTARGDVERELDRARSQVTGLQAQRDRYAGWLAARQRAEQEAAATAAAAAAQAAARAAQAAHPQGAQADRRPEVGGSGPSASDSGDEQPTGRSADTVIQRALGQVGVTYAWGGGASSGPTRGIRDGGEADAHDDYDKVGFDCSGLMTYAFAGAGVRLAHFSGYQYSSGHKVLLAQARPGDMLFWQTDDGFIHHVALYLGNGKMIEAPYSGAQVRVTSVRYDGIMPFAVRVL